jgi:formylglycine-generating enzyme required for sulfatase activity
MKRILGIAMVVGLVGLPVMAQEVKTEKVHVVDLGKDVKLEMMLIPAGKFKMGVNKILVDPFSNIPVKQPPENETPQHEVTLTNAYYMGKYEVTQEQWFEIMGENPSMNKGRKLPVTNVSWTDCQKFIKKLNATTKGGYRLPTEAEWEYACRAGTTTAYSFGDKITPKDANYYDSNIKKTVEVGSYKPNAFGLYDMHGNVLEWCEDRWQYYKEGAVTDPKGSAKETERSRVVRGGHFDKIDWHVRSGFRAFADFDHDYPHTLIGYGFRLARTK